MTQLLNLKDKAQYGFPRMTVPEVRKVMRRAGKLSGFAAEILARRPGTGCLASTLVRCDGRRELVFLRERLEPAC